jgi:hypothetical protein
MSSRACQLSGTYSPSLLHSDGFRRDSFRLPWCLCTRDRMGRGWSWECGYFLAVVLAIDGAAVGSPVTWQIAAGRSMAKLILSSAIQRTTFARKSNTPPHNLLAH